jgi:hypothetical protein
MITSTFAGSFFKPQGSLEASGWGDGGHGRGTEHGATEVAREGEVCPRKGEGWLGEGKVGGGLVPTWPYSLQLKNGPL